jgi:hypothetical protein
VTEDRIRDGGHEGGEDDVAPEAHALGYRTRDERRRRPDESELEEEEGDEERLIRVEEERR